MLRFKHFTKEQFADCWKSSREKYYRLAYCYTKNEHDALEILSEATYKGYCHFHQLKQPEFFDTWMSRIVITVNGVRSFDPKAFMQEAEKCSYVKTAYREIFLDDSAVRIVLELYKDTGFEVTEYKEPALLELRLFPQSEDEREIWFIRSRKMEMSEELALLAERLAGSKAVIAGTQDGRYIVSIGEFDTEEMAQQVLRAMDKNIRLEYSFSVDHCICSERPE